MNNPSANAWQLLQEFEVGGGEAYYVKKLSRFTWPGASSGPTIGIGIDTAYYTPKELANIFDFLPEEQIQLIQKACGKTGSEGKSYTAVLRKEGIVVSWVQAVEIFDTLTWPKFSKATEKVFPGVTELCEDAYGALVSLVFNRGVRLSGDNRREMRNIKDLVPLKDYKKIAREIRSMKRLWEGKNEDGLLRRRDAEAKLIESCI